MKVLFDRFSHQVVGVNRPALPFEYSLELEGTPILSKTLSRIVGQVQKTNEEGLPLYLDGEEEVTYATKEIPESTREVTKEEDVNGDGVPEKVTYTETIPSEVIELEPVMVDNIVPRIVTFKEEPHHFTYDEVVNAPVELEPMDELRAENLNLKIALAEIGTNQAINQLNTQISLAELGRMIATIMNTGGTE